MNRRFSIVVVLLFALLSGLALAAYTPPSEADDASTSEEEYKFDWYDIEQWEVELCTKFGGLESTTDGTKTQNNILNLISQDMVMTLQAEKTLAPDGKHIYEFGYYIQPTRIEEQIIYEIQMRGETETETVVTATAGLYNDFAGYYLERLDANFTHVHFSYTSQRGSGSYDFPFIENDLEGQ